MAIEYVIFAFDNDIQASQHDVAVMQDMKDKFPGHVLKECRGVWQGVSERSWWTTRMVYDAVISKYQYYLKEQECILGIPQDGRNKPYLEYQDGTMRTLEGSFRKAEDNVQLVNYTLVRETMARYSIY